MSVDERLTDLEIRVVYQDKLIASLDEVVREFADRVAKLEQRLRAREEADAPVGPANEPPPHY